VDNFAAENPFPDGIIPVPAGIYNIAYYISTNDTTYTAANLTTQLVPLITGLTILGTSVPYTQLATAIIPQRILVPDATLAQYPNMKYFYEVQRVADDAFYYGYDNITKLVLPNSMLQLGNRAFNRSPIIDLTFPIQMKWVYNNTYPCINSEPTTLRVTKGINGWPPYTDDGYGYGERAVFPWSHYTSSAIGPTLILDKGIKLIPSFFFSGHLRGTTKVVVSEGVTAIHRYGLTLVELQSVVLPISLTSLSYSSIGGSSLGVVYYRGTREQWDAITKGTYGSTKWYSSTIEPIIICDYTGD
jgi:hypothetical protein